MVGFLPRKESVSYSLLRRCEKLAINILTAEQETAGRLLSTRTENKFEGLEWFPSTSGAPVLADTLAWIDVSIADELEAGDHWFVLCAVEHLQVNNPAGPLLFFQGGYGSFVVPSLVARTDHEIRQNVRQEELVRKQLEALARKTGAEASLLATVGQHYVAVAAAALPGLSPNDLLGERVPFVPPLGDTIMYAEDAAAQEKWLASGASAGDEEQRIYRARLDFCREHGYLMSHFPKGDATAYEVLRDAARQVGEGTMTPAQEKQLRASIAATAGNYDPVEFVDRQEYELGSIVVPIAGADGRTALTLRLADLPRPVDGAETRGWAAAALATAAKIREKLGFTAS